MPYFESKSDPGLSAEIVKQGLPQPLSEAILPGMTKDRLVVRHDALIGVAIKVFQVPGATLLRVNRVLCPAHYAVRAIILLLCVGIPAIGFILAIVFAFWGRGTFANVVKSLGAPAGPLERIPWSEGLRRAQPQWYQAFGLIKIIAGLAMASFAVVQIGRHWYHLEARDLVVVIPLAVLAVSFGLRWLYTGTLQLLLKPAPLKLSLAVALGGGLAALLVCPPLFRAYWSHFEESEWQRARSGGGVYDYCEFVPDAIQRPDALLELANWRAGQLKEGLTEYYIKSDLDHVTFVIEQFHRADPAFQPAYDVAKKALATWKD